MQNTTSLCLQGAATQSVIVKGLWTLQSVQQITTHGWLFWTDFNSAISVKQYTIIEFNSVANIQNLPIEINNVISSCKQFHFCLGF